MITGDEGEGLVGQSIHAHEGSLSELKGVSSGEANCFRLQAVEPSLACHHLPTTAPTSPSRPLHDRTDPHGPGIWFTNSERSQLYQLVSPQSYNIFQRESSSTTTRFGPVYVKTYTQEGTCDNSIRASITPVTLYSVVSSSWFRFHSAAPVYTPPTHHLPLLNH